MRFFIEDRIRDFHCACICVEGNHVIFFTLFQDTRVLSDCHINEKCFGENDSLFPLTRPVRFIRFIYIFTHMSN